MPTTHVNIDFIKPLLTITKVLAVTPNYNFVQRKLTLIRSYKCYAFFFGCVLNMFVVYCSLGRYKNIFQYMSKTRIFLELVSMTFLYLINFLSTGSAIFLKSRQFEAILVKFAISDDIISKYKLDGKKINTIYLEITGIFTFTFLSIFLSCYLWISTSGFKAFKYYFCEHFEKLRLLFIVWVSYKIVLAVRYRFIVLNHALTETLNNYMQKGSEKFHHSVLGSNFKSVNHSNKWSQDLRTLAKLYTLLYEIVELFNNVFGWTLLFVILNNICGFLVSAHHVITFNKNHLPIKIAISFVAFSFTYAAPFLTLGAVLASYCNGCVKASRETSTLAYKFLNVLKDSYSEECQRLCEDLQLLAQQAATRYPIFTAAGFCKIDNTMLFTMIGIFTSYLVVIIQFIKMYEGIAPPIEKH